MTNSAGNPMDAVAGLMLERQRFEQWIAQLESRRAITPPHVFERVRADYQRRLDEVSRQLAGRTSEVQAAITALTERLARLSSEETALRDERYEAELRSHVGEMTPAKWSALEKESDERLAKLTAERTNVTADIARLQQLVGMAGAGGSAPVAAPDAARPKSFDELEFLKSVTGAQSGASAAINGALPAPPAARSSDGKGAPARSSAPVSRPATPAGSVAQGGAAQPAAGIDTPPDAPAEPPPVPSFLKDVPQEQTKTLRCGECGAMNFPTEWYCERCGAELAGM